MDAFAEAIKGYQEQRKVITNAICNTNTSYTHFEKKMKTLNDQLREIDQKIFDVLECKQSNDGGGA